MARNVPPPEDVEDLVMHAKPDWSQLDHLVDGARPRGFTPPQLEYLTSCIGLAFAKGVNASASRGVPRPGGVDVMPTPAPTPTEAPVAVGADPSGCRLLSPPAERTTYKLVTVSFYAEDLARLDVAVDMRARRHLEKLSAIGIGRRTVADISGVAESSLAAIRTGAKSQIRKETEAKILRVTKDAISDGTRIDASKTWERLDWLLRQGFTRQELARRLGSTAKTPALQIRRDRVNASTHAKVERLYRELVA